MRSTIYKFELKKLFCARINIMALAGLVLMLVFLAVSSIAEARPVSREAAKVLNGRAIDEQLLDELKPALRYVNGATVFEITGEHKEYVPVMDVFDVMITAIDEGIDLTTISVTGLYERRGQELVQRLELQGLTDQEKEFWMSREVRVQKPFVYRYHRGPGNLLRALRRMKNGSGS